MFSKHNATDYSETLPGIRQKTLVFGKRTLMTEFLLRAGSALPDHHHPHEQTGYLVAGHIQLRIGDATFDTRPGDFLVHPDKRHPWSAGPRRLRGH